MLRAISIIASLEELLFFLNKENNILNIFNINNIL